ncbi:MAG: hypothetical protein LBP52_06475 [Burkholderiaceae bacterium]|nr:hypothetical protein [Burkholderiaceae bacterium]
MAALATGLASAQSAPPPVAGLRPYERPASAPSVAEQPRTQEQLAHDLRGISAPVPGNVAEIAATGNWFVPLRRTGMAFPYDPRGLHDAPAPATLDAAAAATDDATAAAAAASQASAAQ